MIMSGYWPVYNPETGVWSFKDPAAKPNMKMFDEWGGLIVEGLSSISEMSLRDLVQRSDIKIPQTPDRDEFNVKSGDLKWTFRAPSHIGFIQERMEEFVNASSVLPYQRVLWTARELRGENKKGDTVIGPELSGTAATGKVPAWFGACLHLIAVPGEKIADDRPGLAMMAKDKFQRMEFRLYLIPHPDARTGITLEAKNRLPAEVQARLTSTGYIKSETIFETDHKGKLLTDPTTNEPVIKERIGLNTYYDMESKLQEVTTDLLAKELGIVRPGRAE